jgi:hypothetical protein
MVKAYVLLLLLLLCNMTMGGKVTAEFDAENDLIYYNGKIYLPSSGGHLQVGRGLALVAADGGNAHSADATAHANTSAHGGDEELGGGQFWFYIFSITCKKMMNIKITFIKIFP